MWNILGSRPSAAPLAGMYLIALSRVGTVACLRDASRAISALSAALIYGFVPTSSSAPICLERRFLQLVDWLPKLGPLQALEQFVI